MFGKARLRPSIWHILQHESVYLNLRTASIFFLKNSFLVSEKGVYKFFKNGYFGKVKRARPRLLNYSLYFCYNHPMQDTRNVIDEFKGLPETEILARLDERDHGLIIALENTERDFNAGTIVRSANAFGVRRVIFIGRRQWNKRGAMMTDKYLHVEYTETTAEFIEKMRHEGREIIAVDNIEGSQNLSTVTLPKHAVLVFGQEGPGISAELAAAADNIVAIEQFGSTRSINVGSAAAVVMYAWLQQHVL